MKTPKALMVALAAILVIGATPALAQLAGTWKGEGDGACSPPPIGPIDFPIYAWQNWKGDIPDSENEFYGDWYDEAGHYGNFKGKITLGTPTEVVCLGTWTWFDTSVDPPKEYVMGRFWMKFHKEKLTCIGEWSTSYSDEGGTMKGEKVE